LARRRLRRVPFFEPPALPNLQENGPPGRILDGARRAVIRHGAEKISMNIVAETAGVSRASVYNYFPNREVLLDAVIGLTTEMLADDASSAMATEDDLIGQVTAMTIVLIQWGLAARAAEIWPHAQSSAVVTAAAAPVLQRLSCLIQKCLEEARERGEVRLDLNIELASEWLVRAAYSLLAFPPQSFDETDPNAIETYMKEHAVRGLI
jgi:AcrR family transcriptional regulator